MVGVRARLVDSETFKSSTAMLTLSWSTNSRKIQVQGPGGLLETCNESYAAGRVIPPSTSRASGNDDAPSSMERVSESYQQQFNEGREENDIYSAHSDAAEA